MSGKGCNLDHDETSETQKPNHKQKTPNNQKDKNNKASADETAGKPKSLPNVKSGDKVFTIRKYEYGDGDYYVIERIVKFTKGRIVYFENGFSVDKDTVYDCKSAKCQRAFALRNELTQMQAEIMMLRKAINATAQITPAIKGPPQMVSSVVPQQTT